MSHALNAPQREAVRHVDGPLLVLAGAGSGKTRVITAKIAHLIERGMPPAQVAAITFTNKAAREMRERASSLLAALGRADAAREAAISTFHSLGLSIVRAEARRRLQAGFSILDPADLETSSRARRDRRARVRGAAQWRIGDGRGAGHPSARLQRRAAMTARCARGTSAMARRSPPGRRRFVT